MTATRQGRLVGLDVARCLALLGMVATHVLDARTGTPTRGVVATWVVADTAAVADGAATALFFVEPDRLVDLGIAAVWIDATGLHSTPDFPGEVFA